MPTSFTNYTIGALLARLGDEMSSIALLLLGLTIAQSGSVGSSLVAALTLAAAIGGPLLGAMLDRARSPGNMLAGALTLYAVGISVITLLLGRIPFVLVLALALATGLLMPVISGGWSSRVKDLVTAEKLSRASAIDATIFNIAGLAGPAIAGLVAAHFGTHWSIVLLVAFLVFAVPFAWVLPKRIKTAVNDTHVLEDVKAGFKVIASKKLLLRTTLTSVISYSAIGMMTAAAPLVSRQITGNAGFGGVLLSVLSVSALLATVIYARSSIHKNPDVIVFVSTLGLAAALALLAFAHNTLTAIIAMLIVGVADGPQLAAVFAVRNREAPDRIRSQVFTTGASLKITAAAFGFALAGWIAPHSLFICLLVASAIQLMAAMAYLLVRVKPIRLSS